MNNHKVSIIIPIYNVGNYIARCLESCINQTYKDIEIICINDCTTDDSAKYVTQMSGVDNRIRLIENAVNSGVFFTKDKGAKSAKGDFLLFLDGDDYLSINAIELLINKLSDNVDVVAGNINLISENNYEYIKNISWPIFNNVNNNDLLRMILELNKWYQHGMLIRKSVYDKIKFLPFEVRIREDAIIMLQICNYADRVVTVNEPVYFYLQRQSSALNHQKTTDERAIEDFKYASNASNLIDELQNISNEIKYLIRSELIKELSWTLNSKIILNENKVYISNLIKGHLLTSGMFKYIYKSNGIKSLIMYIGSFYCPEFWIWATKVNKRRLNIKT